MNNLNILKTKSLIDEYMDLNRIKDMIKDAETNRHWIRIATPNYKEGYQINYFNNNVMIDMVKEYINNRLKEIENMFDDIKL